MVCSSRVQPSLLGEGRPDTREQRKSSLAPSPSSPNGNEFKIFFLGAYTWLHELNIFVIPNSHHLVMVKHHHLLIKCMYQPICPHSQCPLHRTRHQQLHNPAVMVLYMLHRHHYHRHHHPPVCIPQSRLSHSQLHIQSTHHTGPQDLVHLEVILGQGTWNLQPKLHIQHRQVGGKDIVSITWLVIRLCSEYSESRAFYGQQSFFINCTSN